MSIWRPWVASCLVLAPLLAGGGSDSHQSDALARSATAPATALDADQLLADLHALASPEMEGRRSGTVGNRRARELILARFIELKLQPLEGGFQQSFPLARFGDDRSETASGVNLMALAPGSRASGRVVIVSAHYDHLGVRQGQLHPGADDNASGVAVLLAAAAWFARHPALHSVLLVAFDAEEQGLRGSRHFVAHAPVALDRIIAVVNADMVGRGDTGTLVAAGTFHYPALKPFAAAAADGRQLRLVFGHDRPARDSGVEDWTTSSDHASFHAAGVPFLYFGVPNHIDYHTSNDTADRVPREFFVEAADVILDTVRRLAHGDSPGGAPR